MSASDEISNFDLWVHTLQTTDLPQATNHLRNGDAYCCLGVACKISPEGIDHYDGGYDLLPPAVAEWLGLRHYFPERDDFSWEDAVKQEAGLDIVIDFPNSVYPTRNGTAEDHTAATYNDDGMTFAQIADMIEYFGVASLRY